MIGEIEVGMRDEELAEALQAILSGTVDVVRRVLDGGGRSHALAELDEVALCAVEKSGLELVQLQGVLLQLHRLVHVLVVADLVVGQRVLENNSFD